MTNTILKAGLASAFIFGSAVTASASLLDFTDNSVPGATFETRSSAGATGTLSSGITWELLPNPNNFELTFVDSGAPGAIGPLAGDNDGVGVQQPGTVDDEITAPIETLTLTFSQRVIVTGLFFLDLFSNPDGLGQTESALVSVDGAADVEFFATEDFVPGGFGFAQFATTLAGRSFVFSAATTNDNVGDPDFALAGVEVEVAIAPVPLPAGLLLLGTGLAGLGLTRRRRKQS